MDKPFDHEDIPDEEFDIPEYIEEAFKEAFGTEKNIVDFFEEEMIEWCECPDCRAAKRREEDEGRMDLAKRERLYETTLQQIRTAPVTYLHPDPSENV